MGKPKGRLIRSIRFVQMHPVSARPRPTRCHFSESQPLPGGACDTRCSEGPGKGDRWSFGLTESDEEDIDRSTRFDWGGENETSHAFCGPEEQHAAGGTLGRGVCGQATEDVKTARFVRLPAELGLLPRFPGNRGTLFLLSHFLTKSELVVCH